MIGVGRRGCIALCKRRLAAIDPHRGQPVQADGLDQGADVGLRVGEPQGHPLGAQPLGQAGEVDHQRRVGEAQLGEVDDDVSGGGEGSRQRAPAAAARRPVLVALDPEDRELLVEADDPGKLQRTLEYVQGEARGYSYTLFPMIHEEDILEALSNVIDPELGLDFVELGLVYGVEIDGGRVEVTYTLTTPACPIGPQVAEQMQEFLGEIPGVEEVVPTMVFSPPWTPDKMSEDAKFALGY
jgi:metal-sulfur cluster biosynthetic enzyme